MIPTLNSRAFCWRAVAQRATIAGSGSWKLGQITLQWCIVLVVLAPILVGPLVCTRSVRNGIYLETNVAGPVSGLSTAQQCG